MINPGLSGKVVCITGANNPRGIGAAIARAFALQGSSVFIHFYRQAPPNTASQPPGQYGEEWYRRAQTHDAEHLLREIGQAGGKAAAWEADLSSPSSAIELMDQVEKTFGSVDVLVNNAALCEPDTFKPNRSADAGDRTLNTFPVCSISAASHDRHFAVNSRAPALLMAEFARRHIAAGKRWGRIINISSDGAWGCPDEVSYWASKHALESYSRAAAQELGPYGITVNIASLGPIQTGWMTPELESAVAKAIPLGCVGQPEDVADVVVFLASEQARWLTGQLLYVGGGNRMHQ
jgi:Dehydrogenases with different specificities (related to short-chain alcohol dehydrogenases)